MTRRLPVWMSPATAGMRSLAARLVRPTGIHAHVTTHAEAWMLVERIGATRRDIHVMHLYAVLERIPKEANRSYPNRGYVTGVEFYETRGGQRYIMLAYYQTLEHRYVIVATDLTNAQEASSNGRHSSSPEAGDIPF